MSSGGLAIFCLLVLTMFLIAVVRSDRRESLWKKDHQEKIASEEQRPDYKRIAELERDCATPVEHIVTRAAQVAENYWNNPGLLSKWHPHVREYGWPHPISYDWSLCHCPPETRNVVEDRQAGSTARKFTCGDCGKPLT